MKKQKVEKKKMKMQKLKKLLSIPKKMRMKMKIKIKTCCLNLQKMLMIVTVGYSHGKDFNSFINEFDHAANKEDKEKIVKELKEIGDIVYHYAEMEDNSNEQKRKLFDIINAIDYFLYEYSKKLASDFNWREAVKDY